MSSVLEEARRALASRYKITSELGAGHLATVFLAQDLADGRQYAIKVFPPELSSSIDRERFFVRIQAAARLAHPNIVPIVDAGELDGFLYYTMPFVEGESLRQRLDRDGRLPISDAISITREVADALAYAHLFGVTHKDVKPENILLRDGHAIVIDFDFARGLEKQSEWKTRTGMVMGTLAYTSPEQLSALPIDGRSDVFSLACVSYEMLAGESPFVAPSPPAIWRRVLHDAPTPLSERRTSVPAELQHAIMRALEKAPTDRLDASQFRDAILETDTTQYGLAGEPTKLAPSAADIPRYFPAPSPRAPSREERLEPIGQETTKRPDDDPYMYRVWFGTNRQRARNTPTEYDGGKSCFTRSRDRETHVGWCDVRVPRSHKIGSLGSPLWRRIVSGRDDRLAIELIRILTPADYWQQLAAQLRDSDPTRRRATVFLHGYNVGFAEAARRAAQIGFDLQVPGPMCFFAWPSKARLFGYAADAASVEASEPAITDYLATLSSLNGVSRVDVIAHSMGNRGLLRAIQRILANAESAGRVKFGHFILAAPDVDCAVFKDLAALYNRLAQRTTLYISDRDKALWLSRFLYRNPRAGFAPPVTVVDGIDTVHVSNVDLTLLGHGYVAEAREVLHDMHALLVHGAEPSARMGLRPNRTSDGRTYWVIGR